MPSRPPTAGRRPDSEAGRSVASSVDTGAWVEFKAFPDPIHKACEHCDLEVSVHGRTGNQACGSPSELCPAAHTCWRALYSGQAVVELLDGEGAVYMEKKLGRERDVNALATVEGNKGGWTLIFYAAAGGQPDVVRLAHTCPISRCVCLILLNS
jgi:hypothetical protein